MVAVVNSKLQTLDPEEIISIAAQDTGSPYSPEQVKASIVAESHAAGAILMRQGNTLYIVHRNPKDEKEAFFRALNADTAKNYIDNTIMFIKAIHMAGVEKLITQFQNNSLLTVVRTIERVKPIPTMERPEISQVGEGTTQVIVNLGPKSKGGLQ